MNKILLAILFFSLSFSPIHAIDYVLPYPSYMPGNPLYLVRQLLERAQEYWYFGDIAKVKYHMKMADKYLVEAKTLFEYGQLRLAIDSLHKSNYHFSSAVLYERDVIFDKKDNGEQKQELKEAGEKHADLIKELDSKLPDEIEWQEEKKQKEEISLSMLFKEAMVIRDYANR
jgi:uncharacterized protein (UPF0332 family)